MHQVTITINVEGDMLRTQAAEEAFYELGRQIMRGRVVVSVKDAAGVSRDVEILCQEDMNVESAIQI